MPILSDATIRDRIESGSIGLDPFDPAMIQPASVDFRLHPQMLVFNNHTADAIDPHQVPAGLHQEVEFSDTVPFVLHPGEFVLGSSLERLTVPADLVALCHGKSSLARLGLQIHTAGLVDPGFTGQVVLEFANVSRLPIKLWAGMKIGQFTFETLDRPALKPYGHPDLNSKYQGQSGVVGSRYTDNTRLPLPVR